MSVEQVSDGERLQSNFLKTSYNKNNSCVWLSASLVVNSVDPDEAGNMVQHLQPAPNEYEWLNIFGKRDTTSLSQKLNQNKSLYSARRIKGIQRDNILDYILNEYKAGLYVALLKSTTGETTHTIGINVERRIIFDCMEERELEFTLDNLSKYCWPHKTIERFTVVAELYLDEVTCH